MESINFINTNEVDKLVNNIGIILHKQYLRPTGFLFSKLKTEVFSFGKENSNVRLFPKDQFYGQSTLQYPGINCTCFIQLQYLENDIHKIKGFSAAHAFKIIKAGRSNTDNYSLIIKDFIQIEPSQSTFYISNSNSFNIANLTKIDGLDLVTFEINGEVDLNRFKNLKATEEYEVGDQVFYLGYPLATPLKFVVGEIIKINKDEIETNCEAYYGSSGSPLFKINSKNEVFIIGMMIKSSGSENIFNNTCNFVFDKCKNISTAIKINSKLLNLH